MFDLDAARKAGYSDAEIVPFLEQQYPKFDVFNAVKSGYSLDEIVSHLGGSAVPPMPDDVRNEKGLEDPLADDIVNTVKGAGKMVKAGGAGITDLELGNGLDQAATDVNNVMDDKAPETKAGKVGSFIGEMATPANIAMGEGLGVVAGATGDALAPLFKGWGQQAARNAIGFVKSLANKGDVEDLPAVADFVMNPIKIGDQTLDPILTATSSSRDMLAKADNVLKVAGPKLGEVSQTMDAAINAKPELIDLGAIEKNLEALKGTVEKNAKELGAPVVAQYEKAIADFHNAVSRTPDVGQRIMGQTPSNPALFTALQKLKQTVGELMGEGDNVVPSKTAMQKIYGVFSDALSDAASGVSKELGQAYDEANNAFTYASDTVAGLRGKIRGDETKPLIPSLRQLFTSPPPVATAVASGLNTLSKNAGPALQAAGNAAPGILSGLYDGLMAQGQR